MSNLLLHFQDKNIFIPDDKRYCCNNGIFLTFIVDNGIIGNKYKCDVINIGNGEVSIKPNSFNFTYNRRREVFTVFVELNKSRINIIKATVVDINNPSNIVEDIVYIECGRPLKISAKIPEQYLNVSCLPGNQNSLIATVSNLIIGEEYTYSFRDYSVTNYENLLSDSKASIVNSKGIKLLLNNNVSYNSNTKYVLENGSYTINNVPMSDPIAILNNGRDDLISYTGDEDKEFIKNINGIDYRFYYGNIDIVVSDNFDTVSLYSLNNNSIGTDNLFVYSRPSTNTTFSPSNGTIIANRTEQNINTILKHNGLLKDFIITLSITDKFNNYIYSENFTIRCRERN